MKLSWSLFFMYLCRTNDFGMKNVLDYINDHRNKRPLLAVLLDPDVCHDNKREIITLLSQNAPDFVFVGGSHGNGCIDELIQELKKQLSVPIVLFPGNASQFSPYADALLNISLLSGRNPDLLIGQHVTSALSIKKSGIEVIPTAYLLIEGGKTSSVEYISNTRPIPRDKAGIALSTATAGELLGMKAVYLEAGSGALLTVPTEMIRRVKEGLSIPLIVGGGIRTIEQLNNAYVAGADVVVVGNYFESAPEKIPDFVRFTNDWKKI